MGLKAYPRVSAIEGPGRVAILTYSGASGIVTADHSAETSPALGGKT